MVLLIDQIFHYDMVLRFFTSSNQLVTLSIEEFELYVALLCRQKPEVFMHHVGTVIIGVVHKASCDELPAAPIQMVQDGHLGAGAAADVHCPVLGVVGLQLPHRLFGQRQSLHGRPGA